MRIEKTKKKKKKETKRGWGRISEMWKREKKGIRLVSIANTSTHTHKKKTFQAVGGEIKKKKKKTALLATIKRTESALLR